MPLLPALARFSGGRAIRASSASRAHLQRSCHWQPHLRTVLNVRLALGHSPGARLSCVARYSSRPSPRKRERAGHGRNRFGMAGSGGIGRYHCFGSLPLEGGKESARRVPHKGSEFQRGHKVHELQSSSVGSRGRHGLSHVLFHPRGLRRPRGYLPGRGVSQQPADQLGMQGMAGFARLHTPQ
jgi:hypothetical protein